MERLCSRYGGKRSCTAKEGEEGAASVGGQLDRRSCMLKVSNAVGNRGGTAVRDHHSKSSIKYV